MGLRLACLAFLLRLLTGERIAELLLDISGDETESFLHRRGHGAQELEKLSQMRVGRVQEMQLQQDAQVLPNCSGGVVELDGRYEVKEEVFLAGPSCHVTGSAELVLSAPVHFLGNAVFAAHLKISAVARPMPGPCISVKGNLSLEGNARLSFEKCDRGLEDKSSLGGGLRVDGDAELRDGGSLLFRDCGAGQGGGLFLTGALRNRNATVEAAVCYAVDGGAISAGQIAVYGGNLSIVGSWARRSGGAILSKKTVVSGGNLTLTDTGAHEEGGAISTAQMAVSGGSLNILRSKARQGGAIFVKKELVVSGGFLSITESSSRSSGGGISTTQMAVSGGSLTVLRPEASRWGGAIFAKKKMAVTGGSLTVKDSWAGGSGGCIYADNHNFSGGVTKLQSCESREVGGAVFSRSFLMEATAELAISNCTARKGGGIFARLQAKVQAQHLHMSGCSASFYGGCFYLAAGAQFRGQLSLLSCSAENLGGAIWAKGALSAELLDCNSCTAPESAVLHMEHGNATLGVVTIASSRVVSSVIGAGSGKKVILVETLDCQRASSCTLAAEHAQLTRLLCPRGEGRQMLGEALEGIEGAQCSKCPAGRTRLVMSNEDATCTACPANVSVCTPTELKLPPGYMVDFNRSEARNLSAWFRCPSELACRGGHLNASDIPGEPPQELVAMCERGYTGPGCTSCIEGYARADADILQCVRCASWTTSPTKVARHLGFFLFEQLALFVSAVVSVEGSKGQRATSATLLNQAMSFAAVAGLTMSGAMQTGTFRNDLESWVKEALQILALSVSVAEGQGTGSDMSDQCLLEVFGVEKSLHHAHLLTSLWPALLVAGLGCFKGGWLAVVVGCNVFLPAFVAGFGKYLVAFRLRPEHLPGGELHLDFLPPGPQMTSLIPQRFAAVALAILSLMMMSVGSWIYAVRTRTPELQPHVAYLLQAYRQECAAWEVERLVRKVLLALITAVLPVTLSPALQMEAVTLVLTGSLVAHLCFWPYKEDAWNRVEVGLLIVGLTITGLTTCLIANDLHWATSTTTQRAMVLLICCLAGGICAIMMLSFLLACIDERRGQSRDLTGGVSEEFLLPQNIQKEGDDVCLVGASPALGNWDPSRALQLNTGPSLWPRWAKEVALAQGTECKLIIRRRGGQVEWEGLTGNRSWPAAAPASTVSMKFGVPAISFDPVKAPAEPTKLPQPPAVALPQPKVAGPAGYRLANAPASPVPASPSGSSRSGRTPKAHKDLRQKFILDMHDGYEQNIEERFDLDPKAKLGDGAFSVVTRATNRATGAVRAVKSVLKSRVQKVEALKNEIDLARDMDHPNIVRLYGIYEDPRHVYLVMELCQGGELFDRLSEVYSLGEKGSRACMRQVFASVAYCHSKGIVHRDLKPENYLLYDKDKPLDQTLLKLIDFGLAKPLPEAGCLRTRVGTAYYVAPEVLAQAYTEAADVWSSGVIMYIMLCGAPPFNADKDFDILRLVKKGQYSMESGVWQTVSTTAKSLIKACLEMDPKKRITAQDALSHEWFHRDEVDGAPLDSSVLRNLRAFSSANRFRKAALTAVAYQLGEDEQKELREIFMRLDTNGDGYLSLEEIRHGLQQQMEISDLEQVLQEVDSNGDGRIEYTEFLAAAMDQRLQRNETSCWRAFKTFDKDGDGKITYAELQQVLEDDELLTEVPDCEDARFYFDKMDANGDGEVSFEEFMAMLHPKDTRKMSKNRSLHELAEQAFKETEGPPKASSCLLRRLHRRCALLGQMRRGPSQNFETPPKRRRSLKGADTEAPNALKAACEALRKEFAEDYFLAPAKTRLPPDEIVPRLLKIGGQAEACQEALAQAKKKSHQPAKSALGRNLRDVLQQGGACAHAVVRKERATGVAIPGVNALVTENKEEWIKRLEKGFSLLFEGVGSKYRLLENFAQVLSKSGIPIAIFHAFDKGSSLAAFLRELLEQHGWKGAGSLPRLCSALLTVRARRSAAEKHPLVLVIHNLEASLRDAQHLSERVAGRSFRHHILALSHPLCLQRLGVTGCILLSLLSLSRAHLRMASERLPSLAGDLAGCLGSGPINNAVVGVFANVMTLWSAEVDNIFADAAFNMDPYAAMDFSFSYEEVHTRDSYYTVELKGRYPDGLPSCTHPLATKKQTKASLGLVLRCLTQNQKELVQATAEPFEKLQTRKPKSHDWHLTSPVAQFNC
ncbi:CPK2 [Symbiodinium sp. CCMP2592]|nr:CPK2 [Symbiodinium sp. CCMP2592]